MYVEITLNLKHDSDNTFGEHDLHLARYGDRVQLRLGGSDRIVEVDYDELASAVRLMVEVV
jgi:hypothetical protein